MGAEVSNAFNSTLRTQIPYLHRFEPLPNLITGSPQQPASENKISSYVCKEKDTQELCKCGCAEQPTYTENISLADKIREINTLLGRKTEELGYHQLEFNFTYTTSEEIFLKFIQDTSNLGGKLSATQSETFLQVRQKIAMQFKIGGHISSEALIGFQQASENFKNFSDIFNKILQITNNLLSNGDLQDLNEFLQQLRGIIINIDDDEKFKEFIDKLLNQWLEKLFPKFDIGDIQSRNVQTTLPVRTTANISFRMEFKFEMSLEIRLAVQRLDQQQDPIVIDLDGDGIELTSVENGVYFDIRGTGRPVQTAWIKGGDAFLVWDRNGNGVIDNGLELFGDQWGAKNGFEELRKLDSNRDGFIGPEDIHFNQLLLWRDNGDGISTREELLTLSQVGIERISVNYQDTDIRTDTGNIISQKSFYIRKGGSVGRVANVLLNYKV